MKNGHDKPEILVIEDDRLNAMLAVKYLIVEGMRARAVSTAEEGIRLASEKRFDLILMDYFIPPWNGCDAARKIRNGTRSQNTPIIGFTGQCTAEVRKNCLDAGMNDVLEKPLRHEALMKILEVWLPQAAEATPESPPPRGDLEHLKAVYGVDDEFVKEVVQTFLIDATGWIDGIYDAVQLDQPGAMRSPAHTLKSSCRSLGIGNMECLCLELEEMARSGQLNLAHEKVSLL
ncbi:MAG: response regulator, partial [Planctomycetota bacterium]|nr:response regulator [Planctomycetota bacterium]